MSEKLSERLARFMRVVFDWDPKYDQDSLVVEDGKRILADLQTLESDNQKLKLQLEQMTKKWDEEMNLNLGLINRLLSE